VLLAHFYQVIQSDFIRQIAHLTVTVYGKYRVFASKGGLIALPWLP
jgi:hypothetical protein